mmetsp:Transcript_23170/g.57429  ORF Transcript_23170/g.57429 Transcript_23170/m.57429 type:complete len:246 (-) Transcript_23170:1073-1810(-)
MQPLLGGVACRCGDTLTWSGSSSMVTWVEPRGRRAVQRSGGSALRWVCWCSARGQTLRSSICDRPPPPRRQARGQRAQNAMSHTSPSMPAPTEPWMHCMTTSPVSSTRHTTSPVSWSTPQDTASRDTPPPPPPTFLVPTQRCRLPVLPWPIRLRLEVKALPRPSFLGYTVAFQRLDPRDVSSPPPLLRFSDRRDSSMRSNDANGFGSSPALLGVLSRSRLRGVRSPSPTLALSASVAARAATAAA